MWFNILKISVDIMPQELRNHIKKEGGKVYQIGGAVRDEFLGKVSKDLDLIITGIDIDDLQVILGEYGSVNLVGRNYGVLKFRPTGLTGEPIDISVPRIEVSTGEGHKDFEVRLGRGITLEQEQLRRDFWMNAIAKDIDTGELIDIEGKGQLDIKNKLISVINPKAFDDDPLRMLRAIQFAARFDFEIEPKTMQEIKKNAKKITTVSPTRFQEEFRKMFEKANKPTVGVDLLIETGIMPLILSKGKSNPLMDKLDKKAFPTFLALLAEDYGEAAGETIQTLMKVSKVDTKAIQAVVDFQKIPFTNISIIQFLKDRANLDYVIQHIDALLKAQGKGALSDKLKDMKGGGMPTKRNELAVSGRDLLDVGLKGRQIGEAIEYLMGVAVNSKNEKEHLINEAKREFGISKMSWEDLLWR